MSDFSLQLPEDNVVTISVFDLNGQKITELRQTLSHGTHVFRVFLSTPQTYLLSVNTVTDHASVKMINIGSAEKNRIEYLCSGNEIPIAYYLKSNKGETQNPFDLGDLMEYMGYATINGAKVESETTRQIQISSESFDLMFPIVVGDGQPCSGISTLTDIDGNVYNTVQIGSQCWMKENLRVTKYANDTTIPLWNSTSSSTSYRYYPDNDSSNVSAYGYLYNWTAVMGSSNSSSTNPSAAQGICPTGWHVPSDAEWTQLTDYVSSQNQYQCGSNITYIAKALASSTGWNGYTSTCAVGNMLSTNNTTDFSALPAGTYLGSYISFGNYTGFWSATQGDDNRAYNRTLYYRYADILRDNTSKNYGFSVRCVRNDTNPQLPIVITTAAANITENTATCGGNVTFDGNTAVTSRGVCWSTSPIPTINDSHTTDGNGTGDFTSSLIGLNDNTTYYVRAYATNSVGTAYGNEVNFTTTFICDSSILTDADGNIYNTVQIGSQCWMKENLRVTKYANGTIIPLGSTASSSTAYRYNPDDNSSNVPTYGYLYNWTAVMDGANSSNTIPSGVQGICPDGWHVPSDAEWTQLTDYVNSQNQYQCNNIQDNIAKALASANAWNSSTNICAIGNNPSTNNATYFSALPEGYYNGSYDAFGNYAVFWAATEYNDNSYAYARSLYYYDAYVYDYFGRKYDGYSVRCVLDQ